MLANVLGCATAGALLHFPFGLPVGSESAVSLEAGLAGALDGCLAGLVLGVSRWRLLRPLGVARWWVPATMLGLGVGHGVADGAPRGLSFAVAAGLLGLAVGVLQWAVLLQRVTQAYLWVLVSLLGWTLGLSLGRAVAEIIGLALLSGAVGRVLQHVGVSTLAGAVVGAATAALLHLWTNGDVRVRSGT